MNNLSVSVPPDFKYKSFPTIDRIFTCFVYNSNNKTINEVKILNNPTSDLQAHDNCAHIPNTETIAAMREADEIIMRAKSGQRRNLTLDEMFKELGI